MIAETKICLCCKRSIKGRSDKKFCTDFCRNAHHNQRNLAGSNHIRTINQKLRANRRILEKLLTAKRFIKISRQSLLAKKYDFSFFTHQVTGGKGVKYWCCYEFGYRSSKGMVLIKKMDRLAITDQ